MKYSETLLELENTKRLLNAANEKIEKERLLLQATEVELESAKIDLASQIDYSCYLEASNKELTVKIGHIEDALGKCFIKSNYLSFNFTLFFLQLAKKLLLRKKIKS